MQRIWAVALGAFVGVVRAEGIAAGSTLAATAAAAPTEGVAATAAARGDEKRAAPLYTNEDLARVRALRDATGAGSVPAPAEGPASASASATGERTRSDPAAKSGDAMAAREAFWRRQADRHRERVSALRRSQDEVERKLAERRRVPGVRLASDPAIERHRERLAVLARRIREEESRFLDRARRAGALPGWLRD